MEILVQHYHNNDVVIADGAGNRVFVSNGTNSNLQLPRLVGGTGQYLAIDGSGNVTAKSLSMSLTSINSTGTLPTSAISQQIICVATSNIELRIPSNFMSAGQTIDLYQGATTQSGVGSVNITALSGSGVLVASQGAVSNVPVLRFGAGKRATIFCYAPNSYLVSGDIS